MTSAIGANGGTSKASIAKTVAEIMTITLKKIMTKMAANMKECEAE